MNDIEQRQAAKRFAEYWKGKGYEKGESQPFWISLLRDVYGIEHPEEYISFEDKVHIDNTSFIDGYISDTKVLIEQKSLDKDLTKPIRQSDGSLLTPFRQAKRYIAELPLSKHPRWVITCNFKKFLVYDMERPGGEPEEILLQDLESEYYRLQILVDSENEHLKKEVEVSKAAGEIVGLLYDAFLEKYPESDSEETMKNLNILCVRLVFCLYAEDAGVFPHHGMFHDYLSKFETRKMRKGLKELFDILNTPEEDRDRCLQEESPDLAEFPYVNGGLFSEKIEVPMFTEEIRNLLLQDASENFDWSQISPTIFGAVFESTLNPETRRKGGMHYTSIENIHKVIDPLFLNDLRIELDEILKIAERKVKEKNLNIFQNKLSNLSFFDPACGSGNFLTETYISIRRLENITIAALKQGQIGMNLDGATPIKVSISQFYGMEINDFAVRVAKAALWIAESQMLKETEDVVHGEYSFLPLKTNAFILEKNALDKDWETIMPTKSFNYIMGNPPFVGKKEQSASQKKELKTLIKESSRTGVLDYVSAWFYKAALYMDKHPETLSAFVSTDSICQGEHVPTLWKILVQDYNVNIIFAHRTFKWNSEATDKAEVYCMIIGFYNIKCKQVIERKIFSGTGISKVEHINPYLLNAPDIWLTSTGRQISGYSNICYGSMPIDNGNLILDKKEYIDIIEKEPEIKKYLKKYAGADELLKGKVRYCIWLKNASRKDILQSKFLLKRVSACKEFREESKRTATNKLAATPELFGEIRQPQGKMIVIPKVSSKHRDYIPITIVDSNEYIINGSALIIPDGDLYEFGILSSGIHNIWLRAIAETWGHSYQYSTDIYNNFPFPATEDYRINIEKAAQKILDIREKHPDLTIADMYNPKLGIIADLLVAHRELDKLVWMAYGFIKKGEDNKQHWLSVPESLSELMVMYQKLTKQ